MSWKEKLTQEQKVKIAARQFFEEDREQYDNFEQAVEELKKVSTQFIDTVIKFIPESVDSGYRLIFKDGHVAAVNSSDGHLVPMTNASEKSYFEVLKQFQDMADKKPECRNAIIILQELGWALL